MICLFICAIPQYSIAQEIDLDANQSTLASRLANAKNVGVQIDKKLDGYILHVYSNEEHDRHLKSLIQYRIELKTYREKLDFIREKRAKANREGASVRELNEFTNRMNRLSRPLTEFADKIILHRVVQVGFDYIEIQSSEKPDSQSLIPLRRITRVVVNPKDQSTRSKTSSADPNVDPKLIGRMPELIVNLPEIDFVPPEELENDALHFFVAPSDHVLGFSVYKGKEANESRLIASDSEAKLRSLIIEYLDQEFQNDNSIPAVVILAAGNTRTGDVDTVMQAVRQSKLASKELYVESVGLDK